MTSVSTKDVFQESLELHEKLGGKIEVVSKLNIDTKDDLSLAYTPGVAEACNVIAKDKNKAYDLTIKRNTVAVLTDGSAVLGLGNIGPHAALPVMEGKAILFKEYAGVDAFPICVATQDTQEIIKLARNIAPGFGGINLEDIAAPRCFEIEDALQDINIPVFHDDQHGTSIVLLGALLNALKITGKKKEDLNIVINGAGAAGTSIAELLLCIGYANTQCIPVKNIVVCDTKGIISKTRPDIQDNKAKMHLATFTNNDNINGSLADAMKGADVFIGVSVGNVVDKDMVRSMAPDPIIFALSNPIPEIMPDDAYDAGASIVGTGRSDFPNQVNNVLAFPGIFRGAIDAKASSITHSMKIAAAYALADAVENPTKDEIISSPLDKTVAYKVADAVKKAWLDNQ